MSAPADSDALCRRIRDLSGRPRREHDIERMDARLWVLAREAEDAAFRDIGPGPRRLLDNLLAIIVGAGRPMRTCDLALRADARVRRVSMALSELRRRGLVYGSELATLHTTRRAGGPRGLRHITWAETPLGFATAVARARGVDQGQFFGADGGEP